VNRRLAVIVVGLVLAQLGPAGMPAGIPTAASAVSAYGVLVSVGARPAQAELDLMFSRMREAGVGWVRTDFFWHLIEPRPGAFDWGRYDAFVNAAARRSIDVLGILDYSAGWASRDPGGRDLKYPPKSLDEFLRYARATVSRYRSVTHWEVWNEPDHPGFWKGSVSEYAELLAETYRVIKAVNPAARVLVGGLAQGGPHDPAFLDKLLQGCGRLGAECFDILAFHTNFKSPDEIRAQFRANARSLDRHGQPRPIWVTESSYTSDPGHQTLPGYRDGEPGQARYIRDVLPLTLSLGAEVVVWAGLTDYSEGDGPYAASGLLRGDYRPKPSFDAYRAVATGGIRLTPAR
jgi:GH35 family endo-1,4-beta-xylanase